MLFVVVKLVRLLLSEYNDCVTKSHEEHCNLLKTPAFAHYSNVYGINNHSALLNIPAYSMFGGGLPHDLMHDVCGIEGKEMIRTWTIRYEAILNNVPAWAFFIKSTSTLDML